MQTLVKFSQRFGAAALAFAGLTAAAAAHANPSQDSSAAPPPALEPPRQCTDTDAIQAKLRFPVGTTFKLTDAGLVVLKQPKAVTKGITYPEPEPWPNSGG
jgi:hypothetical protein